MSSSAVAPEEPPSGLVPPHVELTGLTEIRIHGVGGSTPEALLGDLAPQQVSGDRTAGFYRTADRRGRHIEAYSWGGLTSHSKTRALWLLLMPFMLANMAGWMARPARPVQHSDTGSDSGDSTAAGVANAAPTTGPYRWFARLAALAVTVNLIVLNCVVALDVLAYQCGGSTCASERWWLTPLTWPSLDGYPSRRLVVGAVAPLALIGLFAFLSYTSRSRYEKVEPPWAAGSERAEPTATAAALHGGLGHPDFWAGREAHARLSRYHLSAAFATLALILTHCASTTTEVTVGGSAATWLYWSTWVGGSAVLLSVVVFLGLDIVRRASPVVLAVAAASLVAAVAYSWLQPAAATPFGGELPGMRWSFNVAWGLTLVLLAPVLIWLALRRPRRKTRQAGSVPDSIFRWGAPFVVTAFGMILANIVALGVIILTAQFVGDGVIWEIVSFPRSDPGGAGPIYLYPTMQVAVTYLSVGLIAVALVALGLVGLGWMRAGATRRLGGIDEMLRADYAAELTSPPGGGPRTRQAWDSTALGESGTTNTVAKPANAWVASIARWRFLGGLAPRVSYLFTGIVAIAVVTAVTFDLIFVIGATSPPPVATNIGIGLAVLIPPAVITLVLRSWRQVDKRRIVGTLWDVGTFFPRSFHPFAPPSYSERAVPELLRRIWFLHDNGGRVLLACHSQGTIVAAAALLRRSPRNDDGAEAEIALATFGSPLRKLYGWAFPAYFSRAALTQLASGKAGIGPVQWTNFYYRTDYIGGPAESSIDIVLPDPPSSRFIFGQVPPRVGSHTGYWRDPHLWSQIDELAARLVSADQGTREGVRRED